MCGVALLHLNCLASIWILLLWLGSVLGKHVSVTFLMLRRSYYVRPKFIDLGVVLREALQFDVFSLLMRVGLPRWHCNSAPRLQLAYSDRQQDGLQ